MRQRPKPIEISLGKEADLRRAAEVGLDWLGGSDEVIEVSWYDRVLGTGGPMEVCADEVRRVALDYACSRGATEHIVTERFDLLYLPVPDGTAMLDPVEVVNVHRGLERDRFENQQGG